MNAKKPQRVTGQIRIIGGQWRGRKLPVLISQGLRPTTDRIRETVFNWLAPLIQNARCLDCFAGSGALGFEALSRYAGHCTFLETERQVTQQLKLNVSRLQTAQAEVIQTDALKWLAAEGTAFDVVFLDPPFRKGLLTETVTLIEKNGWLSDDAWIYLETESETSLADLPVNWHPHREKTAGQVTYRLYHRQSPQSKD